ncbi:MAG: methyltransferase [Candidatus Sumerlaeaceae bacterium]
MRIVLGESTEHAREEEFLDGQLTIVSRDGLHPKQRAILPLLPKNKTGRALVINSDYAVLGLALRAGNPELEIVCHYDDAWPAELAQSMIARNSAVNIEFSLAPDPPAGPWQYVVLPLERRGIADLVRERLRLAAGEQLGPQGLLITSSDTKDDRFIRDEVKKAFGALHTAPEDRRRGGVAYVARKPAKLLVAPPRSWSEYTIREGGETLKFESRLGVFCHDRLDPGSHALMSLMDVSCARRILDLGCGNGVVGIVAALRNSDARVTFIDANARAIESTQRNLASYNLAGRADAVLLSANPVEALSTLPRFDLVITNPPYYGNWRIAELFLKTAEAVLAPGGVLQLVTKAPHWYREQMEDTFSDLHEGCKGGYTVITATRVGA